MDYSSFYGNAPSSNFIRLKLQLSLMKTAQQRQSKADLQPDEVQSRNYEIFSLMEEMFQIRLVQKLSRPMSIEKKQQIFKEYKRKFIVLHQLLDTTKRQTCRQSESTQSRNKSFNSNKVVKQKLQKQDIKKIQSKYTQLLIDGSFKYYPKVAKLYNFSLTLETINIQQWAKQCLEQQNEQKSCCC